MGVVMEGSLEDEVNLLWANFSGMWGGFVNVNVSTTLPGPVACEWRSLCATSLRDFDLEGCPLSTHPHPHPHPHPHTDDQRGGGCRGELLAGE